MVRHEVRRPNLVVWLITIWRRGSQERERPLTLGRRTRSWSHTGAGGRSARTTSARNTAQAVRPRPRGHGRRGKHVRLATAAPSGVWTGGWGTTGTPRTAGRPLRSSSNRRPPGARARPSAPRRPRPASFVPRGAGTGLGLLGPETTVFAAGLADQPAEQPLVGDVRRDRELLGVSLGGQQRVPEGPVLQPHVGEHPPVAVPRL